MDDCLGRDIKETLFRKYNLFSKEDILKSLELLIEYEKSNTDPILSLDVVKNRVVLCEKFYATVKKCKLPTLTDLWWYYEYILDGAHIELNLCTAYDINVKDNDINYMRTTLEETLLSIECEYISIEEYASMQNVDSDIVKKWITQGKLKHAKKLDDIWLIPNIEDKPKRGFKYVQYIIGENKITSTEFPLLAASDSISIVQNPDDKKSFICCFENYKTEFCSTLEITRKEVERLEYTIIESGKATVDSYVQYLPNVR